MMNATQTSADLSALPAHSRLWIFQSSRALEGETLKEISQGLNQFIVDWAAHGRQLFAGFEIRFGRFLIIGVDEDQANASGCSIDKMMRLVQEMDKHYGLDLLNRMKVAYREGEEIKEVDVNAFTLMLKDGAATENTVVFNNTIQQLDQLSSAWEVPVRQSWQANLLP